MILPVAPAKAGAHSRTVMASWTEQAISTSWIPAFAGMTRVTIFKCDLPGSLSWLRVSRRPVCYHISTKFDADTTNALQEHPPHDHVA